MAQREQEQKDCGQNKKEKQKKHNEVCRFLASFYLQGSFFVVLKCRAFTEVYVTCVEACDTVSQYSGVTAKLHSEQN